MTLTIAVAALAACAAAQAPPSAAATACIPLGADWRSSATEDDRRRLRQSRQAWTEALDQARGSGHADEIASEGALLDLDAALPDPMPPAGDYDCRTIKIGTPSPDLLTWVAYPRFHCRIRFEDGRASLTKLSGSQRPVGRLFADDEQRAIFLGTLQLGDERRSHRYGIDQERDLVGILERVGEDRWRLAFPYPHFESLLDIVELTPRAPVR